MMQLWIIGLSILLTSCSTVAPPSIPAQQSQQQRATQLDKVNSWHLQGKIAVQTAQDAGSATINWTKQQQRFVITLTGPLGSGALKLSGRPGAVTLTDSTGKQFTASSPENLLADVWGFRLPVSNLNYWMRGQPVPGIAAQPQYDTYGRLNTLRQQGWQVQYLGYTQAKGVELPSRINITSADMKVKVIVYSWEI